MHFIRYNNTKGIPTKEITCITGKGAATAQTEGAVGLLYMDENTGAVYKCIGASNGSYTWKSMEGAQTVDRGFYYADFSTAISDINGGVMNNALPGADNACVRVFTAENGRLTVFLLDDVSVSTTITVSKDIDLLLGGHKIALTTVEAYLVFAEGTSCTVDGEVPGSEVVKEGIVATERIHFLQANGERLVIRGGKYTFDVGCTTVCNVFRADSVANSVELIDCDFRVNNSSETITGSPSTRAFVSYCKNMQMRGVRGECTTNKMSANVLTTYDSTSVHLEDCVLSATSDFGETTGIGVLRQSIVSAFNCEVSASMNAEASTNTAYAVVIQEGSVAKIDNSVLRADAPGSDTMGGSSIGVRVFKAILHMKNSEVYANYNAIYASGSSVSIRGGVISGWSHGGIYTTHDVSSYVHVKDSVIWNGYYDGRFGTLVTGGSIVSNCDISGDTYMDGCTFGQDGATGEAFHVSGNLFISNSKLVGHTGFQIEDGGALEIGVGCDFATEENPATNALYRKHYPGEELTAEDYNALVAFMNGAGVS